MGFIYLFIYLLVFREHILPPFWVNSVIFVYQYQRLFSGKWWRIFTENVTELGVSFNGWRAD